MSRRRLYTNALVAVVQVVVVAGLLFELYRFLLRQIGTEQLGAWSLVLAIVSMSSIAEFGIGGSVVKFVAGDLGAGKRERAAATVAMCAATAATFVAVSFVVVAPLATYMLKGVIADPALYASAIGLLPWALASVLTTTVAQMMLSTLDACQRTDLRAAIGLSGAAAQLGAAYYFVPRDGVLGVGPALFAQGALTLVLGVVAVVLVLNVPARVWLGGERSRLREILRYGGAIQVIAVAQMLFDPAVKLLLSIFGGLSATGLYEVANKAVIQFRSIIVSAFQMLVPFLAHRLGGNDYPREVMAKIYRDVQGLLIVLTVPYYALVAAALPILLTLWLGRFEQVFVEMGLICLAGWTVNTLVVSSYMISVATGQLKWLVGAHVLIGAGSMVLGFAGGTVFGGMGVIAGSMLGLAAGSSIVPLWFHRYYGVSPRAFVPAHTGPLIAASLVGVGVLLAMQLSGTSPQLSVSLVTSYGLFASILAVLVVRHPVVAELIARKRPAQSSS
ncbi:MAG: hypothetical protein CTY20_05260 [Hyphomicrobium sp.]|nr:MAG: hypothetical protein CTY20_05260 [Hyphomicrobium sp.]